MKFNDHLILLFALSITLCSFCFGEDKMSEKEMKPKTVPLQLFNGKNLEGWRHVGGGKFIVEDGLLKSQGGMGLLWYSKQKFGDVLIHIVYKTTFPDSNSGIFVRIAHEPKDAWDAVHHGYEIQICDEGDDAFDDYHRTGAIYSLSKAIAFAAKPAGEWNQYDIALDGKKIVVWLNNIKINEFDPSKLVPKRNHEYEPERGPRPLYGYIGIQNHDHNKQKNNHVYFKEVAILPLNKNHLL